MDDSAGTAKPPAAALEDDDDVSPVLGRVKKRAECSFWDSSRRDSDEILRRTSGAFDVDDARVSAGSLVSGTI